MSGLSAARVAQASTSYDAARIRPVGVFWVEGRPDGRDVLVRWTREHGGQDLIPDGFSVASYVHEYGGGAWAAADGVAWFCNAEDQRVYRVAAGEVTPISPAGAAPGLVRYADLSVHPGGGWLWAVRERHEPDRIVNELVRIPAAPGADPVLVASGRYFYSFPRPSPDGRWLAWTCWNAPQMPWDGTWLHVAPVVRLIRGRWQSLSRSVSWCGARVRHALARLCRVQQRADGDVEVVDPHQDEGLRGGDLASSVDQVERLVSAVR